MFAVAIDKWRSRSATKVGIDRTKRRRRERVARVLA
jgi:hypothetical protein